MNGYIGDFPVGHTKVCLPFATFASATGASSATSGFTVDDVVVYKNGVTRRSGSPQGGITISNSIDSRVGLNMIVLDLSDNSDLGFYAAGNEYQVCVDAITVDSQTVRFWVGTFSIEREGGLLALLKGMLQAGPGSPSYNRFKPEVLEAAPAAPTAAAIRAEIDANSTQLAALRTSTDPLNFVLTQVAGSPTEYIFSSRTRVNLAEQVWLTDIVPLISGTNAANYLLSTNNLAVGIDAKTTNLPSDPADASDIAALFVALNVSLSAISSVTAKLDYTMEQVAGSPTAYRFTYTALGNILNSAERNRIADHVHRRNYANIRASSDGDSLEFRSGLGAMAKLVNAWAPNGSNFEFTHEDDTTVFGQQAFTSSASAELITSLNTV